MTTPSATRGRVVALAAAGALLVLAASVPTWVTATVADVAGASTLTVSGASASGGVVAVALAAAAGAFALTLVDGPLRRVVSGVVAACGLGILWLVGMLLADPLATVRRPGVTASAAAPTPAPWVALLGGLLVLVAGVVASAVGHRWPRRAARQAARAPATRTRSDWDALTDGDDPTA